jgi:hypothetical protein
MKERSMRYLCIYKPGKESDRGPTQEEMETMGKLIDDMSKAGVLLSFAGCEASATGVRVSIDGGKFTVTDGPFPETKELIAGFCMLQVKSKAEAIEWTKRFLTATGEGRSEVLRIREAPES